MNPAYGYEAQKRRRDKKFNAMLKPSEDSLAASPCSATDRVCYSCGKVAAYLYTYTGPKRVSRLCFDCAAVFGGSRLDAISPNWIYHAADLMAEKREHRCPPCVRGKHKHGRDGKCWSFDNRNMTYCRCSYRPRKRANRKS